MSVVKFKRKDGYEPAQINDWLSSLPINDKLRAQYQYFTYIDTTNRLMLFKKDDTQFDLWCLDSCSLLNSFNEYTADDWFDSVISSSGNWLVTEDTADYGNSQSVTVKLSYIGKGFDANKHLHMLELYDTVGSDDDMGFDTHDNFWIRGLQTTDKRKTPEFGLSYFLLSMEKGEVQIEEVNPCPAIDIHAEGFSRHTLSKHPIHPTQSHLE